MDDPPACAFRVRQVGSRRREIAAVRQAGDEFPRLVTAFDPTASVDTRSANRDFGPTRWQRVAGHAGYEGQITTKSLSAGIEHSGSHCRDAGRRIRSIERPLPQASRWRSLSELKPTWGISGYLSDVVGGDVAMHQEWSCGRGVPPCALRTKLLSLALLTGFALVPGIIPAKAQSLFDQIVQIAPFDATPRDLHLYKPVYNKSRQPVGYISEVKYFSIYITHQDGKKTIIRTPIPKEKALHLMQKTDELLSKSGIYRVLKVAFESPVVNAPGPGDAVYTDKGKLVGRVSRDGTKIVTRSRVAARPKLRRRSPPSARTPHRTPTPKTPGPRRADPVPPRQSPVAPKPTPPKLGPPVPQAPRPHSQSTPTKPKPHSRPGSPRRHPQGGRRGGKRSR